VVLAFGLAPENMRNILAAHMDGSSAHITTGLIGTRELLHELTNAGFVNKAYQILFRQEFPSWLYMINRGATTVWERWDGIRPDGTFQIPLMNSFNHPHLASVGDWLYRKVAGIECVSESPGFKSITIKPYPGGKMNDVKASHESIYGTIRSEWRTEEGRFKLLVEIPVNTTSEIWIPSTGNQLQVNGKPSWKEVNVRKEVSDYHFLIVKMGSGTWEFETDFKAK
jgi:alpha-L-rhamnosidase